MAETADIQTCLRNEAPSEISASNVAVTTPRLTSAGASCGTTDSRRFPRNEIQSTATYSYTMNLADFTHYILSYFSKTLSFSSTSQMAMRQ